MNTNGIRNNDMLNVNMYAYMRGIHQLKLTMILPFSSEPDKNVKSLYNCFFMTCGRLLIKNEIMIVYCQNKDKIKLPLV